MVRVLELVGVWAICLPLVSVALGDFASGLRRSAVWRQALVAEYHLRLCGELAAARANLTSAAHWLDDDAANAGATQLADELDATYPDAMSPAGGACRPSGDPSSLGRYAVALHHQRHADQPAAWPNWITRVVP